MVNEGRLQRVYIRFSRPTKTIKTVLFPPKRFASSKLSTKEGLLHQAKEINS